MTTRVILVRHGQTDWNREERFRGRADVPLNDVGLAQARATGERVARGWSPAAVYSSPLSRARRTAEAIASHLDLRVQTHPGLEDIDYGEWQGRTPEEARALWPGVVDAWYDSPQSARIPSGETLEEVRTRAMAAIGEIARVHEGETVAVVAHTVVNRAILLGVLGLASDRFWRLAQDTCAINVFDAQAGEFTLVSMNDTCHLKDIL
jgi:broad specificity phosphatase PhoE